MKFSRKSLTLLGLSTLAAPLAIWAASLDLDNDGMSDAWQLLHGAQSLAPGADQDGDGVTNISESMAGTDPNDSGSYFKIADFQRTAEGVTVSYDTVAGKEYQIEFSRSLAPDSWTSDGLWRPGDGTRASVALDSTLKPFTTGSVNREWYDLTNVSGWPPLENRLRTAPNYLANTPDTVFPLTEFSFLGFDPDRDNHGSRIRAYLIPPETGDYQFWVTSDDQSQLFLSPTSDPAAKALIAEVTAWTRPNEFEKYPEQRSQIIPLVANQVYYIEFEQVEGGGGDHGTVHWSRPGVLREVIGGEYLAPYDLAAPELIPNGTVFFRTGVRDRDSDGDGSSDFDELTLGTNPESPASGTLASLTAALSSPNTLSVSSLDAAAYEEGQIPGRFLIRRDGNLDAISASISFSGAASAADFQAIPTTVDFPLGSREAIISVIPIEDTLLENEEDVRLTLLPGENYSLSGSSSSSLMIEDARPELFLASAKAPAASLSIGSASVNFWEKGNRSSARVSVRTSNLSSDHQRTSFQIISADGQSSTEVFSIPASSGEVIWTYGADQALITTAIDEGRLTATIITANEPDGELSAQVVSQAASLASFSPPEDPPSPPAGAITRSAAARFLNQATYGSTPDSVSALIAANSYENWIDTQMNETLTPATLHRPIMEALINPETMDRPGRNERVQTWLRTSQTANDQLRQRIAFALSQIFVISDENGGVNRDAIAVSHYYDILLNHAFGNYRDLLEQVAKSPLMGYYLSHLRNRKADIYAGTNPDENFAREIMQLFSIGLVQLNPDGSPKIGPNGVPLPTYDQTTISEMARVFTGWSFHTEDVENTHFMYGPADLIQPMVNFPQHHDQNPKTVVDGLQLPGGQTAQEELTAVLDRLFNHPNTAPFISRLLIQRLTTSNPSPGYIYRVARIFENDGTNTRGNIGAVVKAILLDPEARNPAMSDIPGYGKAHEPLLKFMRVFRLFEFSNPTDTYRIYGLRDTFGQSPMRALSVFNFFLPDHAPQGSLNEAGLVAPEFQVIAETTLIDATNFHGWALGFNGLNSWDPAIAINFDWQPYIDMVAADPQDYIDFLDLHLMSGQMPAAMRTELTTLLTTLGYWNSSEIPLNRVSSAAQVVINSPQAAILK